MSTTTHTVRLVSGTYVELPVTDYTRAVRIHPSWHPHLPGHVPGTYTDHTTPAAQEAAYDWRCSGASTNDGYIALRFQCGHHLWVAADKWAQAHGLPTAVEVRRGLVTS